MHPVLSTLWDKRRAIALYGLLLLGGWYLGDTFKDLTVPEMRPMNEPIIHRMIMTAFVGFILLTALPFVPGAEIGIALLLLFGGQIAPLVYLGMVGALVLAFLIARWIPLPYFLRLFGWLGLTKLAHFFDDLHSTAPEARLQMLSHILPDRFGPKLIAYRYLLLAIALNTPGNSLIGGGGGLAFIAGASRVYGFWSYLLTVLCAVAPVPALFFLLY